MDPKPGFEMDGSQASFSSLNILLLVVGCWLLLFAVCCLLFLVSCFLFIVCSLFLVVAVVVHLICLFDLVLEGGLFRLFLIFSSRNYVYLLVVI